jgi:hypothetical protein
MFGLLHIRKKILIRESVVWLLHSEDLRKDINSARLHLSSVEELVLSKQNHSKQAN